MIGAQVLRMEGKLGTLQAGAFAISFVIDGDPLRDFAVFQDQGRHLAAIVKGGVFHKNRLDG
jgi:imidazolonepropionase-like amidohydrolase